MIKFASSFRNISIDSPLHLAGQGGKASSIKTSVQTGQLEINGLILESEKAKQYSFLSTLYLLGIV